MNQFLWGALAATSLFTGVFFLRFWKTTRDRLFLSFTAAFWVFAIHWVGLGLTDAKSETRPYYFWLRLIAFAVIIAGVIDKNLRISAKRS
jgi:hypothetical protein